MRGFNEHVRVEENTPEEKDDLLYENGTRHSLPLSESSSRMQQVGQQIEKYLQVFACRIQRLSRALPQSFRCMQWLSIPLKCSRSRSAAVGGILRLRHNGIMIISPMGRCCSLIDPLCIVPEALASIPERSTCGECAIYTYNLRRFVVGVPSQLDDLWDSNKRVPAHCFDLRSAPL